MYKQNFNGFLCQPFVETREDLIFKNTESNIAKKRFFFDTRLSEPSMIFFYIQNFYERNLKIQIANKSSYRPLISETEWVAIKLKVSVL